jgi:hypothetical protein
VEGSDPVRRLCAAVTVHPPGPAGTNGAVPAARRAGPHERMAGAVRRACLAAGLDRLFLQDQWRRGGGDPAAPDGIVLVMAPGVHEYRVIGDLVRELRAVLWRRNRRADDDSRLRLRLAFHQGLTRLGERGFEGRAVTTVLDLCASERLGAALSASPGHDLALIISTPLLDDLVHLEPPGLRREGFRRVGVPVAGRPMSAWIRIPGNED